MLSKRCTKCGEMKDLTEFYYKNTEQQKHHASCKECHRSNARRHYDEVGRDRHLQRTFNITLEEYDAMLEQQHGVCAICGGLGEVGERFAVDHDHVTGSVRGLLCRSCNLMLGYAKDRTDVLRAAIEYLN